MKLGGETMSASTPDNEPTWAVSTVRRRLARLQQARREAVHEARSARRGSAPASAPYRDRLPTLDDLGDVQPAKPFRPKVGPLGLAIGGAVGTAVATALQQLISRYWH